MSYPLHTRRKLNVHKTFRRRPGRLLNFLCTFNLYPVPRVYTCLIDDKNHAVQLESKRNNNITENNPKKVHAH